MGEKEILKLSSLDFIEKKENLIFLGPPGVGKTHLATALGIKACSAKYRVLFITAQKLIEDLMLSVKDGTITSTLLAYSRLNLLIINELGYMPITKEQANLLFQLVSVRENWGQVFQDNVVAAAIIDRIVHNARIFFINGSSYRLKSKLEKKKN